ncbi:Bidirectional sugar transporter SWEET17 [Linum grandiflorum]
MFNGEITLVVIYLYCLLGRGTFWRIIKKGSTEEFESLPYICTLLNASLWTYYGSIKPGAYLVATVNGFGILVEIVYVALFLCYAPTKMKAKTGAMVGVLNVGFLGAAVVATWVALEGEARINAIGFLSSALNIVMYGSPLAAMKTVITTKSVEYMPFFLSFFLFLNGGIWTVYALLTKDLFLGVPNGAGFLLGAAQLVLYAMYRNSKLSTAAVGCSNEDESYTVEEGWQREPLLTPTDSTTPTQEIHS